ncbi:hypothetical protein [Alteriqipengyuania lutimaris]|uniref:Uncharacterized protein n=1 Tax=Alteriqipengyuania lutimaris TaxID=1538146 RepID=A0A395LK16_9SPHN|nr:hypothetical protein [Alteriqipengyuania lutimaris]MBB3034025.1 hypothetical protein [Alteriqipengyuania lutimaris]RDS77029.1 hypothetical protein DL238_04990 [Alteriqipengyuania lutimaris]
MSDEGGGEGKKSGKLGKGCLVAGGAFFGLVVLGVLFGPDPEETEGAETVATAAPNTAELSDTEQADIAQWYLQLTTRMQGCDSRIGELGTAMTAVGDGSGDVYSGYRVAREAESGCESAWSAYREISLPEVLEPFEEEADEARESCQIAAMLKGDAAGKAAELFDGDMRPSVVEGIRSDLDSANSATLACAAGGAAVATKAGADLDQLLGDEAS